MVCAVEEWTQAIVRANAIQFASIALLTFVQVLLVHSSQHGVRQLQGQAAAYPTGGDSGNCKGPALQGFRQGFSTPWVASAAVRAGRRGLWTPARLVQVARVRLGQWSLGVLP